MSRAHSVAKYVVSIILVAVLGVLSAKVVSGYLSERQVNQARREMKEQRRDFTAEMTQSMGTIPVGDRLPDHSFPMLDGSSVGLADLLSTRSLVVIFDPYCETCNEALEALENAQKTDGLHKGVLLLAVGESVQVAEVLNRFELTLPVTLDPNAEYIGRIGVSSTPFNILVDENGLVVDMMAGPLDEADLDYFAKTGMLP